MPLVPQGLKISNLAAAFRSVAGPFRDGLARVWRFANDGYEAVTPKNTLFRAIEKGAFAGFAFVMLMSDQSMADAIEPAAKFALASGGIGGCLERMGHYMREADRTPSGP